MVTLMLHTQRLKLLLQNPPAPEPLIRRAQVSFSLPEDLLTLWRLADGFTAEVGKGFLLRVWPLQKLADENRARSVDQLSNRLLLFAADGDGDTIGILSEQRQAAYVMVPAICRHIAEAVHLGKTLHELLESLERGPWRFTSAR